MAMKREARHDQHVDCALIDTEVIAFFYSSTSIKNTSNTGTHGPHLARVESGRLCISWCWMTCQSATTTPEMSNARNNPIQRFRVCVKEVVCCLVHGRHKILSAVFGQYDDFVT